MSKDEILTTLRKHKSTIEQLGVAKIGLFGSYLSGDASQASDIDLYVVFQEGQATYDNFIELCSYLDQLFPEQKVEVVTKGGLSPYIEPEILQNTEYA